MDFEHIKNTGIGAAYKSAEIIRRLQDAGATVQVVMTRAATEFITPLTLQALSGNPVHTELFNLIQDPKEETDVNTSASWARTPIRQMMHAFQESLKQHPPIPPGAPDDYLPGSPKRK